MYVVIYIHIFKMEGIVIQRLLTYVDKIFKVYNIQKNLVCIYGEYFYMENVISSISYSLDAYPTHLTTFVIVLQALSILLFIAYLIRCYIKDNVREKFGVIVLILLFALASTYLFSITTNDACAFECSLNNTTIRVDYRFYSEVKRSGVTSINVDSNVNLTESVVQDLIKTACNF